MIEPWMKSDALMALLMNRGEHSEHAYEVVERVSWLVEGGMSELAAIDSALGYVPHELRDALSKPHAPTPAKGKT